MKKISLIALATVIALVSFAQQNQELTLEYCYEKAERNHPLNRQFQLIDKATELKIENLNKNFLPDLDINGSAHYQSDVTKVSSVLPMSEFRIEPIDKDWYKLTLDLQQTIYDGGLNKKNKMLEQAEKHLQAQEARIEIYKMKDQVNKVYFNILSLQENRRILELHSEVLHQRMEEVDAAVENGALLQSDLDQLRAELIKIDRHIKELEIGMNASVKILSELTGEEMPEGTVYKLPSPEMKKNTGLRTRPEYALMDYEQLKLETLKELTTARDLPKVFGFGQLGYGRPGFDMLNNDFEEFYLVGLKLNWSLYGWGKTKNEKEILEISKEMIENRKRNFDRAINIRSEEQLSEIQKYRMFIEKDREILELREKVTATYEAQLRNGVITTADYLEQLNAESEARLNLKLNEIRLASAIIDYQTTNGNI
jgi:outer membrane protein TolC